MIAGINIGNKNTYTDFGLLMTHRVIGSAPVKTKTLSVPWRDGRINLTNVNGRPYYDNRKLSFDFKLIDKSRFYITYTELAEYVHGQFLRVSLEEDPSYYYYGMCSVSDFDVSKRLGKITVYVDAEPYKYSKESAQEEIAWDDVNFETTVFRYIGQLTVEDSETTVIPKGGKDVVPTFNVNNITSNTLMVRSSRNNKTYTLRSGKNRFPDLTVCGATDVTLTFTGSAYITIDYRESRL